MKVLLNLHMKPGSQSLEMIQKSTGNRRRHGRVDTRPGMIEGKGVAVETDPTLSVLSIVMVVESLAIVV